MAGADWTASTMDVAGTKLHVARAGRGRPVMVLHHEIGTLDRLPFYDALAEQYDVLVPHHPGYSRSERPEWMRSARDIAVIYRGLLSDLKRRATPPWSASASAAGSPPRWPAWRRADLSRLVLVGAMGMKPPQGDIFDHAVSYVDYARAGFHDQKAFDRVYGAEPSIDQLEMWDICREMSFRIAWKPYMYSQTLPHLLGRRARAGAGRVGRRRQDRAAQRRQDAMPRRCPTPSSRSSRRSGHCVDMEQPDGARQTGHETSSPVRRE